LGYPSLVTKGLRASVMDVVEFGLIMSKDIVAMTGEPVSPMIEQ
jgi:hypothetical protein